MIFMAGCKTMDNLGKSVSEYLKTDCDKAIEKCQASFQKKDYENALKQWIEVKDTVCKNQTTPELEVKLIKYYLDLTRNYIKIKKYDAAYQSFTKIMPLQPLQYREEKYLMCEIQLGQANAYYKKRNYDLALKKFEELKQVYNSIGWDESKDFDVLSSKISNLEAKIKNTIARKKAPRLVAKIERVIKYYKSHGFKPESYLLTYSDGDSSLGPHVKCRMRFKTQYSYDGVFICHFKSKTDASAYLQHNLFKGITAKQGNMILTGDIDSLVAKKAAILFNKAR
jgi:tetratricopeptide (TPR) repeat protein